MKKTLLVFLLLAVFCFMMFAGCGKSDNNSSETTEAQSTKPDGNAADNSQDKPLFDKPVTLRLMTPNHPSWPFQADWYVVEAIKEKTNVSFDVITTDDSNMTEKINVLMASGDVPELTFNFDVPLAQRYGAEGAYANVLDYKDKLPNFSDWMDENKDFISDFRSADGRLFVMPDKGISETDRMGWLYRKDVFEKNGLQVPTNETEFYNVLKKLKELYPDSYPFTFRGQLNELEWLAAPWGASYQGNHVMYYDYDASEWRYGPIENNFKDMLVYYNKLYSEGLTPPDFLSLDTKAWQDLVSTDKAFITYDYLGRIDFFNLAIRKENPGFSMSYMEPPKFGPNGVAKVAFSAYAFSGFSLAAKSDKLDEALKYMDWMYTPEAKELLSWGEEGKTYNTVNGKKQFIGVEDVASMRKKYGLSTNGFYALFDYDSHVSLFSSELSEAVVEARKNDLSPIPAVSFTEEELNIFTQKYDVIRKHVEDNVSKFLLGTRPIGEWDAYVKEVEGLGIQQIIDMYTTAYKRQLGGK